MNTELRVFLIWFIPSMIAMVVVGILLIIYKGMFEKDE